MSEQATSIPPAGLGKLQWRDFIKSIALAAGANALLSLYTIINSGAWPTREDWTDILRTTVAFIISYLIKNALTNNVGQFAKPDQPTVTVGAKELEKVIDKANDAVG